MSDSDIPSKYPQQTEHQAAELNAMRRMLIASEGTSSLSIAICNSPALRDYLITKMKESYASLEVIPLPENTQDIFDHVHATVSSQQPTAIFITDIEKLLPSEQEEHKVLKALNASRELWKSTWPCPVVFWLPIYCATLLSKQSRDLWSWISHQFEFIPEEMQMPLTEHAFSSNDLISAGNLDIDRKHFRIAELKQRINEAGDPPGKEMLPHVIFWLSELGYLYQFVGNLEQAEIVLEKSLAIDEKLGNQEGMAIDYGNLANVYQRQGKFHEAEGMLRQALAINEKLGSLEQKAIDYGNLGVIYQAQGKLDEAEAFYKKAIVIHEELGRLGGMASNYCNLGALYQIQGKFGEAEAMNNKAIAINEKLGRLEGLANNYGNLGGIYYVQGKLDEAEVMTKKSLEITEKLGESEGMADSYSNLGLIYIKRGDMNAARKYCEKAIKLFEEIGMEHMAKKIRGWRQTFLAS